MAKKGRKPKGEYSGKSLVFSTRITPQLRKALEKAANSSGRSVSQEVEHRLSRTFKEDGDIVDLFGSRQTYRLMRMMADAVHVGSKDGEPVDWLSDPVAYVLARAAINSILDFVAPNEVEAAINNPLLQSYSNAKGALRARLMWSDVRSGDLALPLGRGSPDEAQKSVAKSDLLNLLDRTLNTVHDDRLFKMIEDYEAEAAKRGK
jgi:hypothetical protein